MASKINYHFKKKKGFREKRNTCVLKVCSDHCSSLREMRGIGRCVIHKEREHMNAVVFLITYSDNTAILGVIKYICHHFTTV